MPTLRRVRRSLPGWALPVTGLVIGLLALLGLLGVLSVPGLRGARDELAVGRVALERARSAVTSRDVAGATTALDEADAALDRAGARARRKPLSLLSPFPLAGSPVKALSAAVRAGHEVVAAGRILNDAVGSFPTSGSTGIDGHDLTAIHDAAARSTDALSRAGAHLTAARRAVAGPAGALLPQVSAPARDLLVTVDRTRAQLTSAEGGLRLMSSLTDRNVDARLLLLSQDSMELRATGGFIGSFGVFHFSGGTVKLERYDSYASLPAPVPAVEVPDEGLAGSLPGPWDLSNSNWWPDFPTSARAAIEMYSRQGGGNVDGVIAVTEDLMGRLIGVVGPVQLPDYAEPVVEAGFAQRALYEVTLKQPADNPRKKFLIQLAGEVFHRLFALPADKLPSVLEVFGQAGATGNLQAYFVNPTWQADIAGKAVDGALPKTDGDFLALVESNMTGSKANADLVRTVNYRVRKGEGGRLRATLDIDYANNGAANDVTNPYYNGYLRVYVPKGTTLAEASEGEDFAPALDGHYDVISTQVYVEPLGKESLHFEYELPKDVTAGGYHLTWLRQPGTPADSLTATVGTQTFQADPAQRKLQIAAHL
jgi:hypothetical protein